VFLVSRQRAHAGAHRVARRATGREVEQNYASGIPARPPLSPEELEMIRQQIEEGFDNIAEVDPEIRGIVVRNWPHLLSKLPPEEVIEVGLGASRRPHPQHSRHPPTVSGRRGDALVRLWVENNHR
jgi:hypothetical protein